MYEIRDELKNNLFARAILSTRKTCENCWHSRHGGCALFSSDCATQVLNRAETPSRWMSFEEGEECERKNKK